MSRLRWCRAPLLILVVLGALWRLQPAQTLTIFDQPFYLGIAHDLVQDGRFTDGFMFDPAPNGYRPSGMRFAPLYPALVALAAELDGGLRRGMDCVVATRDRDTGCPAEAASLRAAQFCALCGFFWLVWWMGGVIGGPALGWLSLVLSFGAAPLLLRSVEVAMTEVTCLVLSTGAMAAGLAAVRATGTSRVRWAGLAGGLLGATVLTRPAFLYLLPAVLAVLLVRTGRPGLRTAAALGGATALVLAPWLVRNWLVLHEVGLTRFYASHTLVQRIAFDTMSWREFGLAFPCWLPDGSGIGRWIAGAGACDRFGWDEHPNSFYVLGLRHMLPETLAASGGYAHHLGYLLQTYILRRPFTHLLVSVPLALRGAYVAHWWGVLLLPAAVVATLHAWRRGDPPLQILAWPAWFMLAFNAAVAVNQVRYNLILVPLYAISGAMALIWIWRRRGWSEPPTASRLSSSSAPVFTPIRPRTMA